MDSKLLFNAHVTALCKTCYFHLRSLRHIRRSPTDDMARSIAVALLQSCLDYCNSLLTKVLFKSTLQTTHNSLSGDIRMTAKVDEQSHVNHPTVKRHSLDVSANAQHGNNSKNLKNLKYVTRWFNFQSMEPLNFIPLRWYGISTFWGNLNFCAIVQ